MPTEQKYEALIVGDASRELQSSVSSAVDANPDVEARLNTLAKKYQIPVDAIRLDTPNVERRAKLDQFDYETLVRNTPATARLLSDPQKAKIAHDDTENLTGIESALYELGKFEVGTVKAIASAVPKLNEGLWGVARAGVETFVPNMLGRKALADTFAQFGASQRQMADRMLPKSDNIIAQSWYSGMQSLGLNALLLPASIASGGSMAPVLAGMGLSTGGGAYGEARDVGKGVAESLAYGGAQGGVEAATEMIGLPALFSILKPGGLLKKSAEYLVKDQFGEQVATHVQDLNEWAVLHPEKTFGDYLNERPNAAIQTALATAFSGSGQVALMKGVEVMARRNEARVQASDATFELLGKLNEMAAASKVLQRDAETFEQHVAMVAENGPAPDAVFISAQTLQQSGIAEQLAQVSPAVAEQFQTALETGGDVRIPIGEYAAKVAPSEMAQPLMDHLKFDPDGFSRAEAQVYMQEQAPALQAEVERVLGEQSADAQWKASAQEVEDAVFNELQTAGRHTEQVNRTDAVLHKAFASVMAARLGISPMQFFEQHTLRVIAERAEGAQYGQENGPFGPVLTEHKGDAQGAIARLMETKTGYAVGALHHPEIGSIDLVWGEEGNAEDDYEGGYGLAKIAAKHPNVLENLQGIISSLPVERKGTNRIVLANADHTAVVRLQWNNQSKHWLLTAYENEKGLDGSGARTGAAGLEGETRSTAISPESIVDQKLDEFYQSAYHGSPIESWKPDEALIADAKKFFGTTQRPLEAGYILPDGTMLDFTGRHETSEDNWRYMKDQRSVDHRMLLGENLAGFSLESHFETSGGSESMHEFMAKTGAMRVDFVSSVASVMRPPTPKQVSLLGRNLGREWGAVTYVDAESGRIIAEADWEKSSPAKVKLFFEANVGKKPAENAPLFQDLGSHRGSFNPSTNTIALLKNADLSTFLHESGHFFLETQTSIANQIQQAATVHGVDTLSEGERQILEDTNALLKWFGISTLDEWNNLDFEEKRAYHEQFARGFESYLFEGKAPSIELHGVFQRFRAWLLDVYKSLKALNVELTDEVRGVFDRMLATTEQIQLAEQGRSMMPLFETSDVVGMSPEAFAQYQALGIEASGEAIENLQARGLRDMQWIHNARGRVIKKLQKESAARRAEVRMEVRREVMSQPVYRAWQFLTGKLTAEDKVENPKPPKSSPEEIDETMDSLFVAIAKLGGLNKAEVIESWGTDPADKPTSGVFGKPVWRLEGGLSIDGMAEALAQYGYLLPDENGKVDLADFEAMFSDELRGHPAYSSAYDPGQFEQGKAGESIPNPKALNAGRFDRAAVGEMGIPKEITDHLEALKMVRREGLHPDLVAELFGFSSGDELVRTLAAAEKPSIVIEELTDRRMLEQYGDLSSPEAIEKAADQAIYNEARARMVATEANVLAQATGKPKVLASAAKEFAAAMIQRLKVRAVKPSQYASAEVRAGKAAAKAMKAGDLETAGAESRNRLINTYAAKAAHEALEEVDKALAYFKRLQKPGKLPAAHFEQIQALLSKFDLRVSVTGKQIDNAAKFRTWAKGQIDQGNIPPNVDKLLSKEQRAAYARELQARNEDGELIYPNEEDQALLLAGYIDDIQVRSYKEATVEELLGLRDTIKQIEHIGRRTKKVLTDRKNREFAAVVESMRTRLVEVAEKSGRKATDTVTPNDKSGRRKLSWRGFFFSHIKAANLLHIMDGGDGGPLMEHLMLTANVAGNGEVEDLAAAHAAVEALLKPLKQSGDITGKAQFFPSIGRSLNRQARIVMAMNLGNESNAQRLLGGYGWSMEQLSPVLATLTTADWSFVQGMWDYYETFRPRVGAMEREINGVEPEWVEARSLTVKPADGETMTLRGGYAPVIYDPRASGKAASFAGEKDAKAMMQAARVASTVSKSFTKARVEEVNGRPLMLSLDALIGGLQDTIHYLHWQPWIIDANRFIKALDGPMREYYGAEVVQQLRDWAGDNAAGMRAARDGAERAITSLARNVSFAGLAFNVVSAAQQITGYTQSIAVVGAGWMGRGVARALANPRKAYLEALAKSSFLRKRASTRMRDLAEVNTTIQDHGFVRTTLDRTGYAMMLAMQSAVDIPTWWAAYEKAIDAGHDEAKAVLMADQLVVDAQGGGLKKDLASIERATGAIRLLTGFMSFMNTTANVNYRVLKSDQNVGAKAVDLVLINALPVLLTILLKAALTPGDSGDDDAEDLAKKYAKEQLSFLFGQFVGFREIAQLGAAFSGEPSGEYGGAVGTRLAGDILKLAKQVGQGEMDDALRKSVINASGTLFRLPSAQINRTITGIEALAEDKTDNPAAIGFGFQRPR